MKSNLTRGQLTQRLIFLSVFAPSSALAQIDDGGDDDDIIIEDDEDGDEEPIEEAEDDEEEPSDDEMTSDDESSEETDDDIATTTESEEEEEIVAEPEDEEPMVEGKDESKPKESEEASEVTDEPAPSTPTTPRDEQLAAQAAEAALVDAPSDEISLSPIKFSTSTWSRFEYREGYDDLGVSRGRFSEGDMFVFRARLGMQTNPLPIYDESDVFVQFTPQASGVWGSNGTIGEANVGIYEGYLKFRTKRLDVQIGRQRMNYGDALVIGDLDWNEVGRAFDGIRAHYKMDLGYLDLFATQVAQSTGTAGPKFFAGDDVFWGAYLGIGHYLSKSLDLEAYFLGLSNFGEQDLTDETTGSVYDVKSAHLMTVGLRAAQRFQTFFYRLEGGLQFGSESAHPPAGFSGTEVEATDKLAYQVDGEVGASFNTRTRVSLGGVYASGDDPDTQKNEGWNELYPTGHKFLGLMDVIGARTNVASGNLKIRQDIFDHLTGQVDAHVFARIEDAGLGSEGGAGWAGTEIDVQLTQALGKYASVRGLYGLFIPASGQYTSDDLSHYLEIQAGVDF